MTTQPEALRLPDALEAQATWVPSGPASVMRRSAAELRRLQEENRLLYQANAVFAKRQEWWNEKMFQLEAQRDALLEALKRADQFITNGIELGFIRMPDAETPDSAHETPGIVRAAIKAVEETK